MFDFLKRKKKVEEPIKEENRKMELDEEYSKREIILLKHFDMVQGGLNKDERKIASYAFVIGVNACLDAGFVSGKKTCLFVEKLELTDKIEENE